MARRALPTWSFTCIDNGGKRQSLKIKAADKQTAINKGFEKARKEAKGDITTWGCSLVSVGF